MKIKYITINSQVLLDIFKGKIRAEVVKNNLPEDARVSSIGHNQFGQIQLVIESDSFPDIKTGNEIPSLEDPLFRDVEPDFAEVRRIHRDSYE